MIRKNVAGQFIYFGLVNASTGAALTGATVSARRSIDGTFAAATGTVTEDTGLGFYKFALSQADTNGNNLGFFFTATSAIPVEKTVITTAGDPTDSVRFGLTALPNAAAGANGGLPTGNASGQVVMSATATGAIVAGSFAAGAIDAAAIAADAIGSSELAATAVAEIAAGVWGDTVAGDFTVAASVGKSLMNGVALGTGLTINGYTGNTPQTGDSFARIGAAGAGLTAIPTIATVTTLTNLPTIPANWLTAAGINAAALNGKGDWNIGKTGYALSAAGVQAIWDALTSALTTVASIGKLLVDNITGNAFTRLGAPSGASVAADIAAVKTDSAAVKVQTDKLAFSVTNQVDANVIDWKGATAPAMTGDAFARLGAPVGASVSADVAAVKVDSAAIKAKTDGLNFTVPGFADANIQAVNDVTVTGNGQVGTEWGP